MSDKPKACPFCQNAAVELAECTLHGFKGDRAAWCAECGWWGPPSFTDSGALEAWNARPIEDALRAEIERLKDALAVALAWTSFGATPWPYGITPWATARLEDRPLMSLPGESTNSQAALRRVRAALADELDDPEGE